MEQLKDNGIIMKKIMMLLLSCSLLLSCNKSTTSISSSKYPIDTLEVASSTPYGKYPETVYYTLANMTSSGNSNMPEGDTYSDNAYTRFLLDKLNIQNINVIEAKESEYNNTIQMLISSKELPDIMIVESYEDLKYLVENDLIEDLTIAYETCASSRIKEMYDSYGNSVLNNVTFDDKIYAMPGTNISDGPNLFWVRQDWLDSLGLEAPETLEDVENIVRQFILQDPGHNGEGNTIGLMIDPKLTGESGYSSEYLLDIVFACYDAYPKQWIEKDGELIYGSIDQNVKEALLYIQKLYDEGIIDQDFILRSNTNIIDTIISGQCGSFFGPWWAPNNPLIDAVKNDNQAVWKPYLIQTDDQGNTSYHTQNPSSKYVVVKKGFEHPEIVFKMISVIFDYLRYDDTTASELNEYFRLNVDPTARPISINVDYSDALLQSYHNILKIVSAEMQMEEATALDQSYAEACIDYLANEQANKEENWAAYATRVEATSLLESSSIIEVESLFFGTTNTMSKVWWKLEDLESETFLKIITGEEEIDYFDQFVKEWKRQGGDAITSEVAEILGR